MSQSPTSGSEISALLVEDRTFPSPPAFAAAALANDPGIHARAAAAPEAFWEGFARELEWIEPWTRVLDWQSPDAKWFVGGKLNASVNCVDRHVRTARRNKAAIIWEGEPGDRRTLTYFDLYREVNRFAHALRALGVKKGDRIAIYLPLIPELAIAMLACARLGAVHSVVFGGFSAESLRDRINDQQATLLITADGGYRRGSLVPLKQMADEALAGAPSVKNVVLVQRDRGGRFPVDVVEGRDHWYHRLMQHAGRFVEPEPMDAEDMLYILYTSGTTGKPKGIVHTTGGYLVGTYATAKLVFDLRDEDVYWCTADIGWVTGHSYVVYGPLANGATVVMYEGAPDWPEKDRFWEIVERHGVTVFYTAPTAIRAFMRWGVEFPRRHDLSSLRLLGSVGEPINPEAWMWYHTTIGGERCPIVDTWWQTETGQILISPLPGVTTTKPGSATTPFPGIAAEIRNLAGEAVEVGGGLLALTRPWPAMLRGIYGDRDRFVQQYFTQWKDGVYFTGDGAKRDKDGYFWILGRVDDVLNVAGHRIGTMEVESALVDHPAVAEAAVVGRAHELKGQAITAFVILRTGHHGSLDLVHELKQHVVKKIGAIARPEEILFAGDVPKTRSGKIMRRLLRDIAEGRAIGDTTTLADPAVVAKLKENYDEEHLIVVGVGARGALGLLLTVAVVGGCGRAVEPPPPGLEASARAEAAERPVLAESANQAVSLGVQVLDARRIAPDTLRLDLAIVDRRPATAAEEPTPARQAALSALEEMSLVSDDGDRRVFPLRDAAGRMVWSGVEPPPRGERRQFWVAFPAPAGDRPRVTLALPGWPGMKAVEVKSKGTPGGNPGADRRR